MIKDISELKKEQNDFCFNRDNFLIVSAGPGAGKTQTLAYYLKEIAKDEKDKEIIVCSFTNKSTNEIKNRYSRVTTHNQNEKLIFITFDRFLLSKIWRYYSNRIVQYSIECFDLAIDFNGRIENTETIYSDIKWKDFREFNLEQITKVEARKIDLLRAKVNDFVHKFIERKLQIDFISEWLLLNFIKENVDVRNYVSSYFERIVIDEAQDLSVLRYSILMEMHRKMNVKVTLVGDERQTLYQFLGARKQAFTYIGREYPNLVKKNIMLTQNFRYKGKDAHILKLLKSKTDFDFKTRLLMAIKCESIKRTFIQSNTIRSFFNIVNDGITTTNNNRTMFLARTNKEVQQISNKLKSMGFPHSALYSLPKKMRISYNTKKFIEFLYIYERIWKGEMSLQDAEYDVINEIVSFLWPLDANANEKFIELFWSGKEDYINVINKVAQITEIQNLVDVWNYFKTDQNYISILPRGPVQVMTFHSAKGLEAENVLVFEKNIEYYINNNKYHSPSFEEMYVAFSRSKRQLYLYKINV